MSCSVLKVLAQSSQLHIPSFYPSHIIHDFENRSILDNAYGFIYVLEGSIVMQVKGGKETTLTPGQTFYEGPDDVHVVGRNASQTKPAKFVVFFVKDKGAPILVPAK
jgi:hypothetical protein